MHYEVISRFFDKERGVYVDPGAACPRLLRRTAERLLRARCIAEVEQDATEKTPKSPRGKAPIAPVPGRASPVEPPVTDTAATPSAGE